MRIKTRKNSNRKHAFAPSDNEVIALCPSCKALQPITVTSEGVVQTRRFVREGNNIYHDCGSHQPCRLFA